MTRFSILEFDLRDDHSYVVLVAPKVFLRSFARGHCCLGERCLQTLLVGLKLSIGSDAVGCFSQTLLSHIRSLLRSDAGLDLLIKQIVENSVRSHHHHIVVLHRMRIFLGFLGSFQVVAVYTEGSVELRLVWSTVVHSGDSIGFHSEN